MKFNINVGQFVKALELTLQVVDKNNVSAFCDLSIEAKPKKIIAKAYGDNACLVGNISECNYKDIAYVNYCPSCQVILSNEESQGGKCDRCVSEVVQMEKKVWFLLW